MTPESAERAAVRVGVLTTGIGALLVAAPTRSGPAVGLRSRRAAQIVGLADLVLVPGLLRGRPRWPWLAARAGLNLVICGYALSYGRHERRAQVASAGLLVATIADLRAARARRGVEHGGTEHP